MRMKSFFQRLMLWCIEFYRLYISPRHPGCCRYSPTCSFSKGGYDPVPQIDKARSIRSGAGKEH